MDGEHPVGEWLFLCLGLCPGIVLGYHLLEVWMERQVFLSHGVSVMISARSTGEEGKTCCHSLQVVA
jgi:hypothetical protein